MRTLGPNVKYRGNKKTLDIYLQGCVCRKSLHHVVEGGVYVDVVVGYVLFGEVDRAVGFIVRTACFGTEIS
jgi:hypothetical protein